MFDSTYTLVRNWAALMRKRLSKKFVTLTLRAFQVLAYAEGALLPTILVVAIYHWITGRAYIAVAIVGATHGSVFTAYILIVPLVGYLLRWPWRTISVAFSVAFIPFATWGFERRIHKEIVSKISAI